MLGAGRARVPIKSNLLLVELELVAADAASIRRMSYTEKGLY